MAFWLDLPNHYANCILDAFVIMPNHVHGIIFIQNDDPFHDGVDDDDRGNAVETIHESSLPERREQRRKRDERRKMFIPKMIGRFKMQTAKKINAYQNTPGQSFWQKK